MLGQATFSNTFLKSLKISEAEQADRGMPWTSTVTKLMKFTSLIGKLKF